MAHCARYTGVCVSRKIVNDAPVEHRLLLHITGWRRQTYY